MKSYSLIAAVCSVAALLTAPPASAQVLQYRDTVTNANGTSTQGPQDVTPAKPLPTTVYGFDSGTGLLCQVGSTATCQMAVSGTVSVSGVATEATQLLNKADLDALVAAAANPAGILGTNGSTIASPTNGVDVTARGAAASGAAVAGNPVLEGCRAATAAPTAVTDGQAIARQCGAEGANVTRPYAIKELMVRGSTGAITNTTQTSIIASAGGSLKNYITAIQCANSGATTSILTFTDAAATVLINPAGGGGSWTFPIPLATAAATAFQVTPGSSSSSQYCSAQGYTGL